MSSLSGVGSEHAYDGSRMTKTASEYSKQAVIVCDSWASPRPRYYGAYALPWNMAIHSHLRLSKALLHYCYARGNVTLAPSSSWHGMIGKT